MSISSLFPVCKVPCAVHQTAYAAPDVHRFILKAVSCTSAHRLISPTTCCAAETLPGGNVRDVGRVLVKNGYSVFLKEGKLYGFKGIAGRFAPIAVHVSLLLVLGGAAFGALAGFEGQVCFDACTQHAGHALRACGSTIAWMQLCQQSCSTVIAAQGGLLQKCVQIVLELLWDRCRSASPQAAFVRSWQRTHALADSDTGDLKCRS